MSEYDDVISKIHIVAGTMPTISGDGYFSYFLNKS
jgi:hypothetical protein